jgi:hypothetical protein
MLKNGACLREWRLPSAPALFRTVPFTRCDTSIFTSPALTAYSSLLPNCLEWPSFIRTLRKYFLHVHRKGNVMILKMEAASTSWTPATIPQTTRRNNSKYLILYENCCQNHKSRNSQNVDAACLRVPKWTVGEHVRTSQGNSNYPCIIYAYNKGICGSGGMSEQLSPRPVYSRRNSPIGHDPKQIVNAVSE